MLSCSTSTVIFLMFLHFFIGILDRMYFHLKLTIPFNGFVIILDTQAHSSLGGTVPADVAGAPAAVAGLGAGGGAVPGHVPHLVAVVARVRLLAAVPRDVAAAVALVAPVLLLAALPGEVPEPVALVALAAAVTSAASLVSLGTLAGKVASPVTPDKSNVQI